MLGSCLGAYNISIHAPRVGSDAMDLWLLAQSQDFYPRSPRGERQAPTGRGVLLPVIAIHAPRVGSDF